MDTKNPDLSVIVPFYNEEGTIIELKEKIVAALNTTNRSFEILFIDDGSTDDSLRLSQELSKEDSRVIVYSLRTNMGKSAALQLGFEKVQGKIVFTMDADLQDDPYELPKLLEKLEDGWDLVSGWKVKRRDPISKTIPSKFFNWVTGKVAGLKLHDFNCGLKIYRKEILDEISIYGEMHRFIPVLAHLRGFRVTELPVQHHPRKWGKTKFGLSRFIHGFLDLITVVFLQRYTKRPLHLFGSVGVIIGALGFAIGIYLTILKVLGEAIGHRPLLQFSLLLILVGVQLVSLGLLAEMITASRHQEKPPIRKLDNE